MSELTATRWTRYGKDRLYVSDPGGGRVGWVDLITGAEHLEETAYASAFAAVVRAWRADANGIARSSRGPEAPVAVAARAAVGRAAAVEQSDVDDGRPAAPAPADPQAAESLPVAHEAFRQPEAPEWVDLALNVPGQAARAQADLELATQRDHSRVGSFLARAFDVKTDERAWRVGAGGEETVGARLEKLTKHGWHILHAVPVGERGSDIDHVVIGHGGVYTLNTKTHPGGSVWVGKNTVRVNGRATQYLRNSRFEADRASKLLSDAAGFPIIVRPALVFLTGTVIPNVTVKAQPDGVFVYDRTDIPGVFKRAPKRITADEIARIYELARRSTTWQPSGPRRTRSQLASGTV